MKIHKVMQNGKFLGLPEAMGVPKNNQLQGTDMEKLSEACGRVCYDSLGQGRSSEGFHAHIKEVGHLNVYEGCVLKVKGWLNPDVIIPAFLRRTFGGLWVNEFDLDQEKGLMKIDFLINARCAMELEQFGSLFNMPMVFAGVKDKLIGAGYDLIFAEPLIVEPADYTSFWVQCSRCMSHELVRHRWQAHVSQRSTRYVDESESPIHVHPIMHQSGRIVPVVEVPIMAYDEVYMMSGDGPTMAFRIDHLNTLSAKMYDQMVRQLESQKVPRKQARGAARFVLPMGLETQMIFGASREEWANIVYQRANEHADAEIAEFGYAVKEDLKITDRELAVVAAKLEHLK